MQGLQQQAYGGDVGHGVHGSHLVEVNLLHRDAVGVALCLGNAAVDRQNSPPDGLGYRQPLGQTGDIRQRGVPVAVGMNMVVCMRVFVGMVMAAAVLCDAVDRDGNMGAADAAALAGLGPEDDAREAQAVEAAEKTGPVGQQLQQGGGEHVPGGAHGAVQIQGIQGRTSRSSITAR